jgi:hypothetical protein
MTAHIKTFLQPFFQSNDQPWKMNLLEKWPEIVGQLASKVTIEKIYQDAITLGVYDSCWMQELYLLSSTLLETINRNLDQPRIKQVRFKLIGKKEQKKQTGTAPPYKDEPKTITLTPTELKALERITDSDLRTALQSFLIRCYQEKRT